jgi:hypothetical protein
MKIIWVRKGFKFQLGTKPAFVGYQCVAGRFLSHKAAGWQSAHSEAEHQAHTWKYPMVTRKADLTRSGFAGCPTGMRIVRVTLSKKSFQSSKRGSRAFKPASKIRGSQGDV